MNKVLTTLFAIICVAMNTTALALCIIEGDILLAIVNAIMLIVMTKRVIAEVRR